MNMKESFIKSKEPRPGLNIALYDNTLEISGNNISLLSAILNVMTRKSMADITDTLGQVIAEASTCQFKIGYASNKEAEDAYNKFDIFICGIEITMQAGNLLGSGE